MKLEDFVYDNYLSKTWCDFCTNEIVFNTKCKRATYFIRHSKKKNSPANKTITKHWHMDCFKRVETLLGNRAGRVKNPAGRYGAKTGG